MKKISKNITAETHPSHYMMHKYWGRKPHNVVRDYILNFTKPGEVVLDPFMGSGVVVIESIKNDRKAIGVDLNPMACFITKNTISRVDIEDFEKTFEEVYKKITKNLLSCTTQNVPDVENLHPLRIQFGISRFFQK